MKLPSFLQKPISQTPAFDAAQISQTIDRALSAAGLNTDAGPMRGVTDTIRQALASAGLGAPARQRPHDGPPVGPHDDTVIDVSARVVEAPGHTAPPAAHTPAAPGQFLTRSFSAAAGSRSYKFYVPGRAPAEPMPLLVMLHGCTQSADDFAAGTQMNRLAEAHGFIVVYPEQAPGANMSKCWNWFNAQDQGRDGGEPSLIAGITREVIAAHAVDRHRVFVAGLSAGAAMAVVMGETYPELYAGVGAHSGLPYASANDIPSAMAAMKGRGAADAQPLAHAVPTIVFHGDRDTTVKQTNGVTIAEQACDAHAAAAGGRALSTTLQRGESGRPFSRTVHADASGQGLVESWVLHGAGHAWSGGDASGSYTDRAGPDASAEMLRFFLAQRRPGSA